jgi:hypothetical protein
VLRIASAVLVTALATSARAQAPGGPAAATLPSAPAPTSITSGSDGGWSLVARAGTYVPVMGLLRAYRPGVAVEAGFGRRLGSILALEVSGLYLLAKADIPVATTTPHGAGVATSSELTMAGGLATLRAVWAVGPVELHAGAGLSWCWIQQYQSAVGSFYSGGYLADDRPVGAHGGAGVSVRMTPAMHLSADLRYTRVEPRLFGRHVRADGIGLAAGVGYRF